MAYQQVRLDMMQRWMNGRSKCKISCLYYNNDNQRAWKQALFSYGGKSYGKDFYTAWDESSMPFFCHFLERPINNSNVDNGKSEKNFSGKIVRQQGLRSGKSELKNKNLSLFTRFCNSGVQADKNHKFSFTVKFGDIANLTEDGCAGDTANSDDGSNRGF